MPVGGVKANIGHAEPAAGITGLLKLAAGMLAKASAPNAQLRALNPMVSSAFRDVDCTLVVQPGRLAGDAQAHGGVSSFGYSGTIVHAILSTSTCSDPLTVKPFLTLRRRAFGWCTNGIGADAIAASRWRRVEHSPLSRLASSSTSCFAMLAANPSCEVCARSKSQTG